MVKKPVLSVTIICCLIENMWRLENIKVCELSSGYESLVSVIILGTYSPMNSTQVFSPKTIQQLPEMKPKPEVSLQSFGTCFLHVTAHSQVSPWWIFYGCSGISLALCMPYKGVYERLQPRQ